MKRLLSIASAVAAILAGPHAARSQSFHPDLVISEITNSGTRVAVGDLYEYTVRIKNIGGWFCTNGFRIVINVPREVDLVDNAEAERQRRPNSPLACANGTCRADRNYFLWPGQSLSTTVLVKARQATHRAEMTARAEADGCNERNRANNTGRASHSVIFQRPRLKLEFGGPQALGSPPPGPEYGTGVYTLTVTNLGGPATDVALIESHPTRAVSGYFNAPAFLSAYKGPRVPELQMYNRPPNIVPECGNAANGGRTERTCRLRVTLQPQEQMQARYRFGGPCPAGVPASTTFEATIRAMTAEDLMQDGHSLTLRNTC